MPEIPKITIDERRQILSTTIKSPHLNIKEKIAFCLDTLNPEYDEILFTLTPDEKPYFTALRSVIEEIKNQLLKKLTPHGSHKYKREVDELLKRIKKAMYTMLAKVVESQDISEFEKIVVCYDTLTQNDMYTKAYLIPHQQIAQKIKETIDNINNLNLIIIEKGNNKDEKAITFPEKGLIQQLQDTILILLKNNICNQAISALRNISECCDALDPDGKIGRVLLTSRQSSDNKKILQSVQLLVTSQLITKIKTVGSEKAMVLYQNLIEGLENIQKSSFDVEYKNYLRRLLGDIKFHQQFYPKKRDVTNPSTYLELQNGAHVLSVINSNSTESKVYKDLCKEIKNEKLEISGKINKCIDVMPSIIEDGRHLLQVFLLIQRYLIPTIQTVKHAAPLYQMLQGIREIVLSKKIEIQNIYSQMMTKLECLNILLKTSNPYDSKDNASIQAAYNGIMKCWGHAYFELNNAIHISKTGAQQQSESIIESGMLRETESVGFEQFDELLRQLHSIILIKQFDENALHSNITGTAANILNMLHSHEDDLYFAFFEKYKELMEKLAEATSIFDIRDIFYEKIIGIKVQEMQPTENIIINHSSDNSDIQRQKSFNYS